MERSSRINNMEWMTWQWHDATVYFFHVLWSQDGERTLRLRCRVNPEEDRQLLIECGIHRPVVDIEFRDIVEVRTMIHGAQANREVLLTWSIVQPSPFVAQITGATNTNHLTHHRIECSGGSIIDIVGGELWLSEVDD